MSRIRPLGGPTHTVATCDVVIVPRHIDMQPYIYVQDYSYETLVELPLGVKARLDEKHVRFFNTMKDFTEWLVDYPAVVDCCWVIP